MKNKIALSLSGLVLMSMTSCLEDFIFVKGNGHIETEQRITGTFSQVDNSTRFRVICRKADTTSVTVTADQNLLEHIVTEVSNHNLEIRTRPINVLLDYSERPVITVTSPLVSEVNLSGSGSIEADTLTGNSVSIKVSGSGKISVASVNCTNITTKISGSGDIDLPNLVCTRSDFSTSGSGTIVFKGRSDSEEIHISGSGKADGRNFVTNTASVSISGSGDVWCKVVEYLNASISGSGDIFLYGDPRIDQHRSGSGKIKKQEG